MEENGKVLNLTFKITLLVILVLFTFESNAATLYKDCILGDDFGDDLPQNFSISPVGKYCKELCDIECKAYSRNLGSFELNADIINECKVKCRNGEYYSSNRVKVATGTSTSIDPNTYTTQTKCAAEVTSKLYAGYPYETETIVAVNESIQIKLRGRPESSVISMCGARMAKLKPSFNSYTPADWSLPTSQAILGIRSHYPKDWHARNFLFTDTGIFVKDTDVFKVTYTGKFRHAGCKPGALTIEDCTQYTKDRVLMLMKPGVDLNDPFSSDNYLEIPGDKLATYGRGTDMKLIGYTEALNANSAQNWKGLSPIYEVFYDDSKKDADGLIIPDTIGTPSITFSGQLKDFSGKYAKVALSHFDGNSQNNWLDNVGGFDVDVLTMGCVFSGGQRLQYSIGAEKPDSVPTTPIADRYLVPGNEDTEWADVPQDVLVDYAPLKVKSSGKLYLRIKPISWEEDESLMPTCANGDAACNNDLTNLKDRYKPGEGEGGYFVSVNKLSDQAPASNVLSDTVRDVRKYFYGDDTKVGLVQTLFNRFVSNSNLVSIIRALILLYVTWTGLSFVIGIAQITQREAVMRIFYLGLVITLLSPKSWEFFNTYLFQLFMNGGIQLMSYAMNPVDLGMSPQVLNTIAKDPSLIFSILDKPLLILFAKKTWIKIYAIILTSFLGIILAIAIIFAGVIYGVTIVKAMMIYVVSLIFMSILIFLAPIFISFVLFKYTRQMFVKWLEQLASVMLQPVFIVLGLGIFSNLILMGLYAALSVSVCSVCYFSFYIPVVMSKAFCILPGYMTVYGMHSPPSAGFSPVATVSAVFYFLIVAQGAYVYCSKISDLINAMISGFFQGVNLGGYANIGEYTTDYFRGVGSAWNYARLEGTKDSRGNLVGMRAKVRDIGDGGLKTLLGKDAFYVKKDANDPKEQKFGGIIGGFAKGVNTGVKSVTDVDMKEKIAEGASAAAEKIKSAASEVKEKVKKSFGKDPSDGVRPADDIRRSGGINNDEDPGAGGGARR